MAVWAAVLITYGISVGIAMDSAEPGLNEILQLDMAPNSVDDMYDGCKDKMKKVEKEYLQNEKNKDKQFKEAWDKAENALKPKNKKNPPAMWKVAIYVYTLVEPKIYLDFNNAVRTQRFEYNTTFRYHALHFFLTDALQTLNKNAKCFTGYRRVNSSFTSQDVLNKEIRFGSFTSSAMGGYPSAERFGDESCFKIFTCSGADISEHSTVKSENEVLIPPYEVFKVTKIERRSDQKSLPCKVVYTVKRQRTVSNTNCTLITK